MIRRLAACVVRSLSLALAVSLGLALSAATASAQLAFSPAWSLDGGLNAEGFGYSVASAGDVNGDGFDDAIVGAPSANKGQTWEGRAFLFRGSASGLLNSSSWSAESNVQFAFFGTCVAGAGDVNGDGFAELLVGAMEYSDALAKFARGRAFVFLGGAAGLGPVPDWYGWVHSADNFVGQSVAGGFDVNNDGFDDVIAGGMNMDSGAQHAQMHHGGHFAAISPYGVVNPAAPGGHHTVLSNGLHWVLGG